MFSYISDISVIIRQIMLQFKVVQLPKGEKCCRIKGFNKNDTNSIITNYYQSGPFSIRSSVIIEIIMVSVHTVRILIPIKVL